MSDHDNPHAFSQNDVVNYEKLDWPTVHSLAASLAGVLQRAGFRPDYLLAIHDPESAGAYTVAAQLALLLSPTQMLHVGRIQVEGRSGTRTAAPPHIPPDAQYILVVDDVSWSGQTLSVARESIARTTKAVVRSCTLLAGRPAIDGGLVDYYARRSGARDVSFPWGVVTPTAEFQQYFDLPGSVSEREVSWAPRPWGYWEQFALNEECTVRILTISPGQCLSLQYHMHRDEFFIALDDGVILQVGDKRVTANKGDYVLIPRTVLHRHIAPASDSVRVLEVSFGKYDQVNDIVRLDDKYGRTDLDGSV